VPAICASEDQEDANEDFTAGGSLPRFGGGVLQSCRHHADAADAGSIHAMARHYLILAETHGRKARPSLQRERLKGQKFKFGKKDSMAA
jgi:hypothetical protein